MANRNLCELRQRKSINWENKCVFVLEMHIAFKCISMLSRSDSRVALCVCVSVAFFPNVCVCFFFVQQQCNTFVVAAVWEVMDDQAECYGIRFLTHPQNRSSSFIAQHTPRSFECAPFCEWIGNQACVCETLQRMLTHTRQTHTHKRQRDPSNNVWVFLWMEFSNSVYFSQYEGVCFMNDYQKQQAKRASINGLLYIGKRSNEWMTLSHFSSPFCHPLHSEARAKQTARDRRKINLRLFFGGFTFPVET